MTSPSYTYTGTDAATIDAIIQRQREEADREYQLNKDKLDNEYRVALMNARTNADVMKANRDYQEGQVQIARDRLQFDKETQAQEFGLKQAKLGYDLINTQAQLSGPANYFKAAENARGVSGQAGTSTFLTALQNNARLAGYGAQAGTPTKESLGTLTAKLTGDYGSSGGGTGQVTNYQNGGGGGTGQTLPASGGATATAAGTGTGTAAGSDSWGAYQTNSQNYSNQIGQIGQAGAHKLASGQLEQLTPTELSLFKAGLADQGFDPETFLTQYNRSRVGQTIGLNRAA